MYGCVSIPLIPMLVGCAPIEHSRDIESRPCAEVAKREFLLALLPIQPVIVIRLKRRVSIRHKNRALLTIQLFLTHPYLFLAGKHKLAIKKRKSTRKTSGRHASKCSHDRGEHNPAFHWCPSFPIATADVLSSVPPIYNRRTPARQSTHEGSELRAS